ncbi:PREDICTED: facilitated trehalose transporter Tret1-like [Ceratosolen solmsi marchali]|uniref:Facilitated trehalose transporter Tret1-like n=1 Tax=Ceratosolen solmsi marchali TaxID=326594 RepID=A0AAJ7DVC9_9HYME|nr:PREDICTED: facilitated trehalose transporter Tret1-like [Ceratosolen solmsi marchali]
MVLSVESKIIFPQWYTGIGVTLLLLQMGFLGGWVSPTLARLMAADSPIPLTVDEASWVASILNFCRFFGSILGAVAANYLGSKRSIFVSLFPISAGWLIISLANQVKWLYLARVSSGVGIGMVYSTFPLFIGEVSTPEIRGALISLATCGVPVGQLITSIGSSFLSLSTSAVIYVSITLPLIALFVWLPESPHHLIKIGKREEAKKSIDWYRAGTGVEKELDAVEKFVESVKSTSFFEQLRELTSAPMRKALFQVIALFTFMQISGVNSVLFYMETILTHAKVTVIEPFLIFIYVNVAGIFAAALSILLIDTCGRRFLLMVSSSGVGLSMIGMTCHFLLMDTYRNVPSLQFIPIASMFLFVTSFYVGLFPVPNAILSELFPANIKCVAASVAGLTGAMMAFLSTKTYQPLIDLMGEAYVFMIYAICAILVIPFSLFIMSETKGKSLQQIQDELTRK